MGALLMRLPADEARQVRDSFREPPQSFGDARKSTDHADKAYEFMTGAKFSAGDDPEARRMMMDCAKVHAHLAMMDKLEELTATLREIVTSQCDSMRELDATIQKATNAMIAEVRRATVKEVA